MKSTDEIMHVFDSHVAYRIIDLSQNPNEFEDYTREELIDIIKEAGESSVDFIKNWLDPALDELDLLRIKEFKDD